MKLAERYYAVERKKERGRVYWREIDEYGNPVGVS